jgi:hypothetical protein
MRGMFHHAVSFNMRIKSWNVSYRTDILYMFAGVIKFYNLLRAWRAWRAWKSRL